MIQGSMVQLQQQNTDLNTKVQKLEAERSEGNSELANLKGQLDEVLQDAENQQKRKEKLDKDLKELRQTLETRQNEINSKKEELTRNGEGIAALEKQLKDERGEIERLNMKHDQLERTRDSLKTQHTVAVNQKQKVLDENADLKATLEDKKDEIKSLGS